MPTMLPVTYEVSPPSSTGVPDQDGLEHPRRSRSVSPVRTLMDPHWERLGDPPSPNHQAQPLSHRAVSTTNREVVDDHGAMLTPPYDRSSTATRWDDFMHASMGTDDSRSRPDRTLEDLRREELEASADLQATDFYADKTPPPVEPLIVPRKGSKRLNSIKAGVANNRLLLRLKGIHHAQLPPPIDTDIDEDEIKPTLPLKAGRNSPRIVSPTTPNRAQTLSSPFGTSVVSQRSSDATSIGNAARESPSSLTPSSRFQIGDADFQQPLVSRFSMTTYATGTTYSTPPATPGYGTESVISTPCMRPTSHNQSRPMPAVGRGDNTKSTTRKPISTQFTPGSPASIAWSSLSKNLPPSPPEAEPADLITHLQAQLDGLQHRRSNLQRIIGDFSRLMQPGPHACERSTREGMKKTVEECQAELDEVIREQHDIGLRLHRAWRRREREGCVEEPTGLWVRRVTT